MVISLLLAATSCSDRRHTLVVTTTDDFGPGSLRNAMEKAAPMSVIIFKIPKRAAGYDAAANKWVIELTQGEIKFDQTLTVRGDGVIILDGIGESRIFNHTDRVGTLTLDGLAFRNGKAIGDGSAGAGGAVYTYGSLSANGCTFTGNTAAKNGGAVFAYGSFSAAGCTFTGNAATALSGGAVRTSKGTVTLTGCILSGNTANDGGAVSAVGAVTAAGCAFIGNAAYYGGAVGTSSFTATDCVFSGNKVNGQGGAIWTSDAITASDCTFSENKAKESGGAIFSGGSVTVTNCKCTGNTANELGGMVNLSGSGAFTAIQCSFIGNMADIGGTVNAPDSVVATSCAFAGNMATKGGAVNAGGLIIAVNSSFVGNSTADVHSGAIDAGNAYIFHTTSADNVGTGIHINSADDIPKLHAYNSVIVGNSVAAKAGSGSKNTVLTAQDIAGNSLIEGITEGATRATVFGESGTEADGIIKPLAGGLADRATDVLTVDEIAFPVYSIKAASVIATLRKDISGTRRAAAGKVSYGARELEAPAENSVL